MHSGILRTASVQENGNRIRSRTYVYPDYRTNRNCLFVFRIKMFLNKCLKSADTFLFSCKAKIVASCLVHPAVFLNCFKHLVPGALLASGKPGHTHFPVSHGQNGLKVQRASHYHARCGQASSLLEIKKCVYNQINADLLFFFFKNFNNLLRCLSFLSEGKRTLVVRLGARAGSGLYLALGFAAATLCLPLLCDGRIGAAALPLLYLAPHTATWRRMVRIGRGRELNAILGATSRNILLFGILLSIGLLL